MFAQDRASSKFSATGAFSPVKKTSSETPIQTPRDPKTKTFSRPSTSQKTKPTEVPPSPMVSEANKILSPRSLLSSDAGATSKPLHEPSSSILCAYETLLKNQRMQILELIDKNEQQNKKWLDLSEDYHKLKEQNSSKILELETILSMSKLETEERVQRTSNFHSNIMADQIRLKGLILDLSSRFSIEQNVNNSAATSTNPGGLTRTGSSASMISGGGGGAGGYYQATKANNELQENLKLLTQINAAYQRLERNLYELFRIPNETTTILSKETIDLFQTINQQNNQLQNYKNKLQQKQKKWKEENDNLEKSLMIYKNDLSETILQKDAYQFQYEQLQKDFSQLSQEKVKFITENNEKDQKITEMTRQLSQLEHELHQEKLMHDSHQSKNAQSVSSLQYDLQSAKREIDDLKEKYQLSHQRAQQQELEVVQLKEKLKQSQATVQHKDSDINDITKQFEKEIETKHQYIHQLTMMMKKYKDEKQRDLDSYHHLQQQTQYEMQHLNEQIQQLNETKASFESQYKSMSLQYNEVKVSLEMTQMTLQQSQKTFDQKIEFLNNTVALQEKQLNEKQIIFQEQLATINQQTQQYQDLNQKYQTLSEQYHQQMIQLEFSRKEKQQEKQQFLQLINLMISKFKTLEKNIINEWNEKFLKAIQGKLLPGLNKIVKVFQTKIIVGVKNRLIKYDKKLADQEKVFHIQFEEVKAKAEVEEKRSHDAIYQLQKQKEEDKFAKDIYNQQIEEMSHSISTQSQQLRAQQEERQQLINKFEALKNQFNQTLQNLQTTSNSFEGLSQKHELLLQEKDQLQERFLQLQFTLDDLQSKYQTAVSNETNLTDHIRGIEAKSEIKLTALLQEQENLQQLLIDKEEDIRRLEVIKKQLEDKNQKKNQVIQELHQKYTKMKGKLFMHKSYYQKQDNELFQKMGKFSNEILSLQIQLNDLNTVVSQDDSQDDIHNNAMTFPQASLPDTKANTINEKFEKGGEAPRSPQDNDLKEDTLFSPRRDGQVMSHGKTFVFDELTSISDMTDDYATHKY